jgi:hypothetical protein
LNSLGSQAILRRIKKLEKVFAVNPVDDWIEIVMWGGSDCGVFGHMRMHACFGMPKALAIPCQ